MPLGRGIQKGFSMSNEFKEQLKQLALNPRLWVAIAGIAVTVFQLNLDPETTGLLVAIIVATFLGVEKASTGMTAAAKLISVVSEEMSQQRASQEKLTKSMETTAAVRRLSVTPTDFGLGGGVESLREIVREMVKEELTGLGGQGVDRPEL